MICNTHAPIAFVPSCATRNSPGSSLYLFVRMSAHSVSMRNAVRQRSSNERVYLCVSKPIHVHCVVPRSDISSFSGATRCRLRLALFLRFTLLLFFLLLLLSLLFWFLLGLGCFLFRRFGTASVRAGRGRIC